MGPGGPGGPGPQGPPATRSEPRGGNRQHGPRRCPLRIAAQLRGVGPGALPRPVAVVEQRPGKAGDADRARGRDRRQRPAGTGRPRWRRPARARTAGRCRRAGSPPGPAPDRRRGPGGPIAARSRRPTRSTVRASATSGRRASRRRGATGSGPSAGEQVQVARTAGAAAGSRPDSAIASGRTPVARHSAARSGRRRRPGAAGGSRRAGARRPGAAR